jgi:recombination protein RecT
MNVSTNARQPQPKTFTEFVDWLRKPEVRAQLEAIATGFKDLEELESLLLFQVDRNRKLIECSPVSIWRALREAKLLEISPTGVGGRGWLVPRNNTERNVLECQFDPGWRGLLDIAHRSPKVLAIDAKPVFDRDHFEVYEGSHPRIEHQPHVSRTGQPGDSKGEVVAAYCVVHFVGGVTLHRVVDREELEKIRAASTMRGSGPWDKWPAEMALKSAAKRGCKLVPGLPVLDRALALANAADERAIDTDGVVVEERAAQAAQARPKALAAGIQSKMRAQFGQPQPEAVPVARARAAAPEPEEGRFVDAEDDGIPFR